MKTPLAERLNQAYEFIRSFMRTYRKPPTLREIGDALEIRSVNAVSKLLAALRRKATSNGSNMPPGDSASSRPMQTLSASTTRHPTCSSSAARPATNPSACAIAPRAF